MIDDIHRPKDEPVKRGYIYYFGFKLMPAVLMPLLLLVAVGSVIYSVRTRTLTDYFFYAGILAVPYTFYLAYISIPLIRTPRSSKERRIGIITFVNAPVTAFMIAAFYYSIAAAAFDVFSWISLPAHRSMAANVGIGAVTLVFGAALFLFRLQFRGIYGLTEVSAGIFIAAFRFSLAESAYALVDPNFLIFFLTAGVYLVVRGLDNIHLGMTREPDPIVAALMHWYKYLGTDELISKEDAEEGKTPNGS